MKTNNDTIVSLPEDNPCFECDFTELCSANNFACKAYTDYILEVETEKRPKETAERVPSTFWYNRAFETNLKYHEGDLKLAKTLRESGYGIRQIEVMMGIPAALRSEFRRATNEYIRKQYEELWRV